MVIGAFNFFFLSVQTKVVLSSEFWRTPVPTMPGCRVAAIPFFELQGLRLPCAEVEGSCLQASLRVTCKAGVGSRQSLCGSDPHGLGSSACLQTGDVFLCGYSQFCPSAAVMPLQYLGKHKATVKALSCSSLSLLLA